MPRNCGTRTPVSATSKIWASTPTHGKMERERVGKIERERERETEITADPSLPRNTRNVMYKTESADC